MNNKHFYLSYKNDKGEIRSEFNDTIESIMKVEKFHLYDFFDNGKFNNSAIEKAMSIARNKKYSCIKK